jgi:hypothetical protein
MQITEYTLLSCHLNTEHDHNINKANRSIQMQQAHIFENNPNILICEEIKSRLNLGNAYYPSVQNLLSCHLLSKNKD